MADTTSAPPKFLQVSKVQMYKAAGGEEKRIWTDVGVAFPHKDGRGYNILLRDGIAVSGKVVVRAPLSDGSGQTAPDQIPVDDDIPF